MKKLIVLLLLVSLWSCQNDKTTTEKQTETTEKEVAKPSFDEKAYKMKGKEIAMGTFKIFKGKIEGIAKVSGLPSAVTFCNENAKKITDSLGKVHNVNMQRTSHKLRNSDNKPNADQQAVIENYLEAQEAHKPLEPIVMKDDKGFVHFYAPIKLKKKCLACHGKPEVDINEKILSVLKEKYPSDKAINFQEGELRGIWDIKFLN